ncbi:MAG TPA: GGDEF domain-containing response regulator [Gemmatimonadaceae bacterium]|nr:GGDEF domain-containing response regulator [Gemmatimonadaceae bacterium]
MQTVGVNVRPTSVLLIEDDPEYRDRVQSALTAENATAESCALFELEYADRMSTGLARLADGGVNAVLLDLSLPDGHGLDALIRLRNHGPDVAIVVLSDHDDSLGLEAVKEGAQDYLVKEHLTGNALGRAIRYAIERHRVQSALRQLALVDTLTGLYNRRGFFALAEHSVKLAQRTGRGVVLLFADLDGMKQINDTFGHQEGDRAMLEVAALLRNTFRRSDIVGRLGGDEFAILALDAPPQVAEMLAARTIERVREANVSRERKYQLSLTIGTAVFDYARTPTLDHLLAEADRRLYEQKPGKRHPFREMERG